MQNAMYLLYSGMLLYDIRMHCSLLRFVRMAISVVRPRSFVHVSSSNFHKPLHSPHTRFWTYPIRNKAPSKRLRRAINLETHF